MIEVFITFRLNASGVTLAVGLVASGNNFSRTLSNTIGLTWTLNHTSGYYTICFLM